MADHATPAGGDNKLRSRGSTLHVRVLGIWQMTFIISGRGDLLCLPFPLFPESLPVLGLASLVLSRR
jgi:hypothetical protein